MLPYVVLVPYLGLGLALTRKLAPASRAPGPMDHLMGALFMPLIATLSVVCTFMRGFWTRLLIVLDFEPRA
jgi:hypothetical protein